MKTSHRSITCSFASFVLVCLSLVLFVSCSKRDEVQQPKQEAQRKRIRVGYLPMVSSLTYFVAQEKGYFAEEGIDVQGTPIKTSNGIAQDLVAGNIDAAIELSVVPLLKTAEHTPPKFRIFSASTITEGNGFDGVLVRANSPVVSLEDLSGKKVGTFPGTTAGATFSSVFSRKYPGKTLPSFAQLDPSVHLQSLSSGEIDALHAYEPTLTIGMVEHGFKKISGSIYGSQLSPSPIGVAAINLGWYQENQNAAASLFRALDKAVRFIESHPKEARGILAIKTGGSQKVVEQMNIMPMSESSKINVTNLQQYFDILHDMNETANPFDAKAVIIGSH